MKSPLRRSYCPPIPTSPISPSLKPPETTIPKSKIDKIHSTFCGLSNSKLKILPPQARSPSLLVLDLEQNLFQSSALQNLPKGLTILNLVKNPLLDMRIPVLLRLRSLSLDYCGLSSFEGFPFLPQLRFLSVSNNKIKNFKGLPILMRLEYFNIENNAFPFESKLSIAAVGSISLNMFNNVELTEDDLEESFQLSPLVGFSLRCGRDPTPCNSPQDEIRKSQTFLTSKLASYLKSKKIDNPILSLNICKYENQSSIICPFEAKSIKWLRSRSPEHGNEWTPISPMPDQKQPNILPTTMLLRMHLIRCDFVLDDDKTYSLFTDEPIGRSSDELSLPFPLDPVIAGLPLEGSLISLIPLPIPTRVAWMRKNEVIGEDSTSLLLKNTEIGNVIRCLLQPYCPNYKNVSFSTVFVETDVVDPILPTVSAVTFPESIQEGVKIDFTRKMFPDREGESQILIERARGITEEWFVVAEVKPDNFSYIPTCEDAGHYLRVSYAPITTEGVIGATVYFYSSTRVLPTLPVFTNAVIGGLPKTNFTLCAVADYKGGRKGDCSYNWYASTVPITAQNIKSLPLVQENSPFFTIPDDYENYFLACEMVPVREDDVVGEAVYTALTEPIVKDEAPAEFDEELPETLHAGDQIVLEKQVSFYVSSTKGFCGFTEVKRGTNVTLKDNWVGHILRIVGNECDYVVGEIKPSVPEITEINIQCPKYEIGELATLEIKHKNLKKDRFDSIWVRCMNEGLEKAVAYNTPDYVIQAGDIGYRLKVMINTYDDNHDYLKSFVSQMTPMIKSTYHDAPIITGKLVEFNMISVAYDKEMDEIKWLRSDTKQKWEDTNQTGVEYYLTTEDVHHYMRAQISIGESTLIATTNDVIQASKPNSSVRFLTDEATEGQEMKPIIKYQGGVQGKSITEWKRFSNGSWQLVSSTANYKVTKDDVGFKLCFFYTPVRNDNVKGEMVTKDFGIVSGLQPTVTDVEVKQNERGFIQCTGKYSGGVEGPSYYLWHAFDKQGKQHNIGKTDECEIFPPEQLFGLEVQATYCPIRNDGVEGEQVRSSNKVVVRPLPSITSIDILVKDGVVRVGQVLRCKATTEPSDCTLTYSWYRGDGQTNWEAIPNATKADYTPTELDVGFFVLCLVAPTNKEGWVGKGISAATPLPVDQRELKLKLIPEIARATEKEMYWTGAILQTNLGDEIVTWERQVNQEWVVVGDYSKYLITANDVGYRLRAAIDDYESPPSPVIIIDPDVGSFVNATVRARSFQFKAISKMGSIKWEFIADQNGLTMKSKRAKNQKTSKWSSVKASGIDGAPDEVELWMDATTKFVIVPLLQSDPNFKAIVQKNASDFIVLTLKGFISKYGSQP